MTERCRHEKPMCVRIWLEVGHECEPRRSALGRALALDWRVWVRGARGIDISSFVHKVVFELHPSSAFVYPKRVIQEPPYEIQESGCASIEIPIHVYLKYTTKPQRISLRYCLHVENTGKSSAETRSVYYDVQSPVEALWRALLASGGEVLPGFTDDAALSSPLIILLNSKTNMKIKKFKFVEPVEWTDRHKRKKKNASEDICPKCGEAANTEFRKQLRAATLNDDEVNRVTQLYLSYSSYERSTEALPLPHFSDPIYQLPELPKPLKATLKSVKTDYALQ